jgi:uncharacterized protein
VFNAQGDLEVKKSGVASSRKVTTISALLLLLAVLGFTYYLHGVQGAPASYSLLTGLALGFVFQRGHLCFFCIFQDLLERRNSAPSFAILAALAVGGVTYAIVFGAFLPNPASGRLPPDAHIGPVSWVLLLGGLAFGLGMSLAGACISALLYRLGEGYSRAPFGLLGTLVGFGLGFLSWQTVYFAGISRAPVVWLPASLGYGGALLVHLAVIALVAWLLLRFLPSLPSREGGQVTLKRLHSLVFKERWNPLLTGTLVAVIGAFAYFRVEPLGVTAQLGSISRTVLSDAGVLGDRLPGLDGFAGCATQVIHTVSNNGWLIMALVLGSLIAVLFSNSFKLTKLTLRNSASAFVGGIFMGWGAMVSLGCTVGTLLSGISAFALSGWVFAAATVFGVWLGIKLKLHRL